MKLFRRQKSDQLPSSDIHTESYNVPEGSGIDWRRAIPRLLALAVILALIVTGVLWAAGVFEDNNPNVEGKGNETAASSSKTSNNKAEESGSSQSAKSSSTSSSGSSSSQSSEQGSSTSGNEELTNTGPGDVVSIFAITSVMGTVLYQTILRRRLI